MSSKRTFGRLNWNGGAINSDREIEYTFYQPNKAAKPLRNNLMDIIYRAFDAEKVLVSP